MLILRRRVHDKIVFPHLRISLEVLEFQGKSVKIGIDAPRRVLALRGEEADLPADEWVPEAIAEGLDLHRLRNHLNAVRLGLQLFERQSAAGRCTDAETTRRRIVEQLSKIDDEIRDVRDQSPDQAAGSVSHLLLVEDDDNERELLAGLLRINGFRVETAANGRDALERLRRHELPEHVLLDLQMPECNGVEALRAIRTDRRTAHIRVFAVSGHEPRSLGVPPGEGGFDGWFRKPLDAERLIAEMRRHRCLGAP
jgi:CheY-like chemotaxis protein